MRAVAAASLLVLPACVTESGPSSPTIVLECPDGPLTVALSTRLDPARDLAWCASAPLAWEALERFLGGPVELDTRPPTVELLNAASTRGVDPRDYYAIAGITDEVGHSAVRAALHERFGREDERLSQAFLEAGAGQVFTYAFLFKELRWEVPFLAAREPLAFHGTDGATDVRAFGLTDFDRDGLQQHQELSKQVRVWDGAEETFVVELSSPGSDERVLLGRVEPSDTLAATLAEVRLRARGAAGRLRKGDDLIVPIIDLDETHAFPDIAGRFQNAGFESRGLLGAWQAIRFRLDREGVALESSFWAAGAESKAPPEPRRLAFDRPFLVTLLQDETPLFVAWIAGPTFLVEEE